MTVIQHHRSCAACDLKFLARCIGSLPATNVQNWSIGSNRGAAILWSLLGHNGHREALKPEASVAIDPGADMSR